MKRRIERIQKLVDFEKQMMQKMTQEVLSLNAKLHQVKVEIDVLQQGIEFGNADCVLKMDKVAQRIANVLRNNKLNLRIEFLDTEYSRLSQLADDARLVLSNQKSKIEMLEKLVDNRKEVYLTQVDLLQSQELLDTVTSRFLEPQQ